WPDLFPLSRCVTRKGSGDDVVGGSLASSVYGIPRATQDVDLVAKMNAAHAEPLARLLRSDFYVDVDMILDAVRRRASFNVIHLATMFKADVFVMKGDSWSREEMQRARAEELTGPQGPLTIRFASPEDTLLHKLVWYRLGNEISDRQWGDILGVFKSSRCKGACSMMSTSTGGQQPWTLPTSLLALGPRVAADGSGCRTSEWIGRACARRSAAESLDCRRAPKTASNWVNEVARSNRQIFTQPKLAWAGSWSVGSPRESR